MIIIGVKCQGCGQDIMDSGVKCINCGYPYGEFELSVVAEHQKAKKAMVEKSVRDNNPHRVERDVVFLAAASILIATEREWIKENPEYIEKIFSSSVKMSQNPNPQNLIGMIDPPTLPSPAGIHKKGSWIATLKVLWFLNRKV